MDAYPALVPWEDEPRFVFVPANHRAVLVKPAPAPWAFRGLRREVEPEHVEVEAHAFGSRDLGWRGWVLCERGDEVRLASILRAVEGWILFVAWLKSRKG